MVETTVPSKVERKSELAPTRDESRYMAPPVDIYETADALVVVADMPGVDKDGIEVRVDNNVLTLRGRTKHGLPGVAVASEFELVDFFRQFRLSEIVDQAGIDAQLRHGVLTVRLPKVEEARPRQIEIKVK